MQPFAGIRSIAVRHLACLVLCGALVLPLTAVVAADGIAVIVAPTSPRTALSVEMLANIYRKRVQVDAAGRPYVPINLPVGHPLREALSLALFGKRPRDMEVYWNEQYYQGITPPFVLASTEAVLRFVAATPTAIGYVRACDVNDAVRVLLILPAPSTVNLSLGCRPHASPPH